MSGGESVATASDTDSSCLVVDRNWSIGGMGAGAFGYWLWAVPVCKCVAGNPDQYVTLRFRWGSTAVYTARNVCLFCLYNALLLGLTAEHYTSKSGIKLSCSSTVGLLVDCQVT